MKPLYIIIIAVSASLSMHPCKPVPLSAPGTLIVNDQSTLIHLYSGTINEFIKEFISKRVKLKMEQKLQQKYEMREQQLRQEYEDKMRFVLYYGDSTGTIVSRASAHSCVSAYVPHFKGSM